MDVLVSREAGCRERPNRTWLLLFLLFQLTLPLLKLTLFRHCPVAPPSGALRATQIAPGNLVHALLVLLALGEDDQNQLPIACLLVYASGTRLAVAGALSYPCVAGEAGAQ